MKNLGLFLAIMIVLGIVFPGRRKESKSDPIQVYQERKGTAILITGAAARIPQEAALLEELYNRGDLEDVVFISGVSSGAINSVVLNGILSKKMTWDTYKNLLFDIKNSDVFIRAEKRLPLDTEPLRQLLTGIVHGKLGYNQIGDLPYMTELSITDVKDLDLKRRVYRMCSRKINVETDTTLDIVDILMASTSFPIAFPPCKIGNVKTIPNVEYSDGGVGDDHVPFEALLEFERFRGVGVEKVYIISRKSDSIPEISEELKGLGINDNGVFDKLGISMDNILSKGLIKRLEAFSKEAPELVERSYVYVPDYPATFLMFNFENLKQQYILTSDWAKAHNPEPLADYLLPYLIKEKKK
jgi:hypothetical protein